MISGFTYIDTDSIITARRALLVLKWELTVSDIISCIVHCIRIEISFHNQYETLHYEYKKLKLISPIFTCEIVTTVTARLSVKSDF